MFGRNTENISSHIAFTSLNSQGDEQFIGDVHGGCDSLQAVLDGIGPNDTLNIAGDLIDRGENTPGVIKLLIANKRIKAIRGNHEQMFLDAMQALRNILIDIASKNMDYEDRPAIYSGTDADYKAVAVYLNNGGAWIFKNKIPFSPKDLVRLYRRGNSGIYLDSWGPFIEKLELLLKPNSTNFDFIDDIEEIENHILTLPFIHQGGKKGGSKSFAMVHAAMPIQLHEMSDNCVLTPEEISHAIWWRQEDGTHRMQIGQRVYVGHNVVSLKGERQDADVPGVEGDYISLDYEAHENKFFVVVNHTQSTIKIISSDPNFKGPNEYQQRQINITQSYLDGSAIANYHKIARVLQFVTSNSKNPEKKYIAQQLFYELQHTDPCNCKALAVIIYKLEGSLSHPDFKQTPSNTYEANKEELKSIRAWFVGKFNLVDSEEIIQANTPSKDNQHSQYGLKNQLNQIKQDKKNNNYRGPHP